MKKIASGVVAIVLAIAAFAFTDAGKAPKTSLYWFQLNSSGSAIDVTARPQLMSEDPYNCQGTSAFCAGGYSSYVDNHDGTFSASGSRIQTDKKP